MQHLLFRIHGPLCSWGDVAPGTHRPTNAMPTRSAIIGLLASALGLRRDEDERHHRLSASLGMGVKQESVGAIMSDYHTVQVPSREKYAVWATRSGELLHASKLNTILSTREHVEDAAYAVALWNVSHDGEDLEALRKALERPRYAPYLGRRSCPTALPFRAHLVNASSLREAFDLAAFPEIDADIVARLRRANALDDARNTKVEFDEHPSSGYEGAMILHRRDAILSRARRTFEQRAFYAAIHSQGVGP